jgi:trehalose-phosphatase
MLPSALEHVQEIAGRSGRLAIFLDYDGTLTPIVSHPEKAFLSHSMRQTLQALAMRASVAILSGRDLDDLQQRVDTDTIIYAGSHGFDIAGPRGLRKEVATDFLPKLDMVEKELSKELAGSRRAISRAAQNGGQKSLRTAARHRLGQGQGRALVVGSPELGERADPPDLHRR